MDSYFLKLRDSMVEFCRGCGIPNLEVSVSTGGVYNIYYRIPETDSSPELTAFSFDEIKKLADPQYAQRLRDEAAKLLALAEEHEKKVEDARKTPVPVPVPSPVEVRT